MLIALSVLGCIVLYEYTAVTSLQTTTKPIQNPLYELNQKLHNLLNDESPRNAEDLLTVTMKSSYRVRYDSDQPRNRSIAIGGGITSAKIHPNISRDDIKKRFPLFMSLIPSFCDSCSTNFTFHFYWAYDVNDPFFTNPAQVTNFRDVFYQQTKSRCPKSVHVDLKLIRCSHSKKPAWAQNDAMMEAYLDNRDYFYRVNDDTRITSKKWPEIFVNQLSAFRPPNVGVVGPHHLGGNMQILCYDFTHHTHQDIMGFHYPRGFTSTSSHLNIYSLFYHIEVEFWLHCFNILPSFFPS